MERRLEASRPTSAVSRNLCHADIGAVQDQGFTIKVFPVTSAGTKITRLFRRPLVVRVTGHAGDPITGGIVTYTAPSKNASASYERNKHTINEQGFALIEAKANSVPGAYTVTASAAGAKRPAVFSLRNLRRQCRFCVRRRGKIAAIQAAERPSLGTLSR